MREDERRLLLMVLEGERPRSAGRTLGIHPKRVVYLCYKWDNKGFYDYGVAADLGWITDRAEALRRLDGSP